MYRKGFSMRTIEAVEVKSNKEVVATIDIVEYESVDEALSAEGEDGLLALINAQKATNLKNKARSACKVPDKLTPRLSAEFMKVATMEQFTEFQGLMQDSEADAAVFCHGIVYGTTELN